MESTSYVHAMARRWYFPVIGLVLGAAVGWASMSWIATPPRKDKPVGYQAQTVLVGQNLKGTVAHNVRTAATLMTLRPVARRAAETLGYQGPPLQLTKSITAEVGKKNSNFLTVTCHAALPKDAVARCNAFTDGLSSYLLSQARADKIRALAALESRKDHLAAAGASRPELAPLDERIGRVHARDVSTPPLAVIQRGLDRQSRRSVFDATRSRPLRAAAGALIGLLGGIAIALILERYDTTLRTTSSASQVSELPTLGEIPTMTRDERRGVIAARNPLSAPANAFRILAAAIGARVGAASGWRGETPRGFSVLVTSADPGEGKTTVAANLAAMFSEAGRSVVLMSCDFRNPDLHERFGVAGKPGLIQMLDPDRNDALEPMGATLQHVGLRRLVLIAAGGTHDRPGELLASEAMRRVIREASSMADVVILDTPGFLDSSDALPLIEQVDTVVVVARAGKSRSDRIAMIGALLRRLHAPLACVVVNGRTEPSIVRIPTVAEDFVRVP